MEYDQRVKDDKNQRRRDAYADMTYQPTLDECPTLTPNPWANIMLAVMTTAHLDEDQEFLDDVGVVYMNGAKEARWVNEKTTTSK
jgi:hypothetical protein